MKGIDPELKRKMEEELREMAQKAREYAKKKFPERGLMGDPAGWCDDAVKVLEIYADYLEEFDPHARRDIEIVEEVADLLHSWSLDLEGV